MLPNTARVIETFVPVPMDPRATSLDVWQTYLTLLRREVSPLVRRLQETGLVSWYSFVAHAPGESDTPTGPDDTGLDVHLRLEMATNVDKGQLVAELPAFCKKTRSMPGPHPHAISGISHPMRDGDISHAWGLLGQSSEWVLNVLDAHPAGQPIPPEHIAQLLHFVGNQLLVRAVAIPMP